MEFLCETAILELHDYCELVFVCFHLMRLDTALSRIAHHSPNHVHSMWNDMDLVRVAQITAAVELNKTNWMGKKRIKFLILRHKWLFLDGRRTPIHIESLPANVNAIQHTMILPLHMLHINNRKRTSEKNEPFVVWTPAQRYCISNTAQRIFL